MTFSSQFSSNCPSNDTGWEKTAFLTFCVVLCCVKEAVVELALPQPTAAVDMVVWGRCCLCQERGGDLVCPRNHPKQTADDAKRHKGYMNLAQNLQRLRQYGYMLPSGRSLADLDDGNGLFKTFMARSAKWHKKCAIKYSGVRFEGLIKQLQEKQTKDEEEMNECSATSAVNDPVAKRLKVSPKKT